jgi:hypothetical protein
LPTRPQLKGLALLPRPGKIHHNRSTHQMNNFFLQTSRAASGLRCVPFFLKGEICVDPKKLHVVLWIERLPQRVVGGGSTPPADSIPKLWCLVTFLGSPRVRKRGRFPFNA